MMVKEPAKFKGLVEESLRRQIAAINTLSKRGLQFWDYGNSLYVYKKKVAICAFYMYLLFVFSACWRLPGQKLT